MRFVKYSMALTSSLISCTDAYSSSPSCKFEPCDRLNDNTTFPCLLTHCLAQKTSTHSTIIVHSCMLALMIASWKLMGSNYTGPGRRSLSYQPRKGCLTMVEGYASAWPVLCGRTLVPQATPASASSLLSPFAQNNTPWLRQAPPRPDKGSTRDSVDVRAPFPVRVRVSPLAGKCKISSHIILSVSKSWLKNK
jgi:hypothetical protein